MALAAFILAALLLAAIPLTALTQSYGYTGSFTNDSVETDPDKEITRIQFVSLLHEALGISINYFAAPNVKDYFDDMENADIGANELIDLATAGIIESGGSFHPDAPLDRELMIHWTMNALKYETDGNYPIPMVKPVPFSDDLEISEAYRGEIYSAIVLKLVSRDSDTLSPKEGATRAEAAAIVSKLMTLLNSYRSAVQVTASARLLKDGSLTMSLTIRNNTDKAIAISHTSGQKYDFKLFDDEVNNLYTWSADKMFMALVGQTVIEPGDEIVFSDTLGSEAYGAKEQAVSMKAYIIGTSDDLAIDTNGYTAVIAKD
jgi:hypothetical protein